MMKRALFLGIDALSQWAGAVYKNGHFAKAKTRRFVRAITGFRLRRPSDGGKIEIDGLVFNFLDREAFSYNFEEVFINEEYFFLTDVDDPIIIDCGSNIGLATIYFKTVFPKAKITAIEANPVTFAALEKNIADNGLTSVNAINAAAAATDSGEITLYFTRPGDLRSTNIAAMRAGESSLKEATVRAIQLSNLIGDRVDLLKMDIEGAEIDVIDDIESKLANVHNLIIEYHFSSVGGRKTLGEFLRILETAGFYCRLKAENPADKASVAGGDYVVTIYGTR